MLEIVGKNEDNVDYKLCNRPLDEKEEEGAGERERALGEKNQLVCTPSKGVIKSFYYTKVKERRYIKEEREGKKDRVIGRREERESE